MLHFFYYAGLLEMKATGYFFKWKVYSAFVKRSVGIKIIYVSLNLLTMLS